MCSVAVVRSLFTVVDLGADGWHRTTFSQMAFTLCSGTAFMFLSINCLDSEPIKKTGTKGRFVTVVSNHVPICCQNKAVYQYHVTFT